MTRSFNLLRRLALAGAAAVGVLTVSAPAAAQVATEHTPAGFQHRYATVNGLRYHYVVGGKGPALVLLHGWPETWYLWHKVMPELAKSYTVIAPDSRGQGATEIADGGYDAKTVASDIKALVAGLGIESHHLVAHDLGGMVAFSYAHEYPQAVRSLAILDVPIPDKNFGKLEDVTLPINFWHFGFHDAEHVPEMLIGDKIPEYLNYFYDTFSYNQDALSDEEAAVYIQAYSRPGRLTSGLEYYRAIEKNVADTEAQIARGRLRMPVLALGGEVGVGQYLLDQLKRYSVDYRGKILEGCGHWIPSECPDKLMAELTPFLAGAARSPERGAGR